MAYLFTYTETEKPKYKDSWITNEQQEIFEITRFYDEMEALEYLDDVIGGNGLTTDLMSFTDMGRKDSPIQLTLFDYVPMIEALESWHELIDKNTK
ncbi:hypothetical protein PAT01_36620 [Pseudoalteromonas atlantica]|uniref:Uncharacterized protein n=1 Tax=Pseudoalteromonas atlantica TaxID=288 RepID=A0ABQ0UKM2_PSEAF|nr:MULTISPECIES: hypothetical protein [unclassified Pseudoalteromonas]MCK8137316.1 hypothetical protein [Pseudoalteromonas sp. 2CM28B]MCW1720538.1 hypothetical protein [Pseudoalteromonas sp. A3]GEK78358.1 hypothetical protein PAT01_36620 [Pseudoalteromonas atlantica]